MTTAAVDKEVLNFRKEYQIKKVSYPVLYEITEKIGYTVILFNSHCIDKNVNQLVDALNISGELLESRGFTYSNGDFRLVFINDNLSDKEKTIVLSHELGHIVLGHTGRNPVIGHDVQDEFEANEFSTFLFKSDSRIFVILNSRKAVLSAIAVAFLLSVVITALYINPSSDGRFEEKSSPTSTEEKANQSSDAQLSLNNFGDSELYFRIKTILEANLSTVSPNVSYDAENCLINVVCVPPDGTHYAIMKDKSSIEEGWNGLCDNLTSMSDETYKLCLENGYKVG